MAGTTAARPETLHLMAFVRRPALVLALVLSVVLPAVPAPAASGSRAPATFPSLFADLRVEPSAPVAPGDPVRVVGRVGLVEPTSGRLVRGVPATYRLRVVDPDGAVRLDLGPFTAGPNGEVSRLLPAEATRGVTAGPDSGYVATLAVRATGLAYGSAAAADGGAAELSVSVPPTTLQLENAFVSSVGWVKPGETYPFRVVVRNQAVRATIDGSPRQVFFSRQLEVMLEGHWFHWVTNRAIRELLALGSIRGEVRPLATGGVVHLV